jgi:hypothetical protein
LAVAVFTASKAFNLVLNSSFLVASSHTMGIFGNKQETDVDVGVGGVVGEDLLVPRNDENIDFFAAGGGAGGVEEDDDGDDDGDGGDEAIFLLLPNNLLIILYISNTK